MFSILPQAKLYARVRMSTSRLESKEFFMAPRKPVLRAVEIENSLKVL